ncbi:hypothetical protein DAEQUDRAFT_674132 [Daedalea quercina L-15889]|uniref:CoA-dependent acyltransferase n=1 Tax=Daedalea quercina L-15889 TaxID=1314783 RepID=A0A165NGX4_9APHY|nr:hypothetical protein DAEQUDRAFT_674132 [Daedalea quercina L-15889]
MNPVQNEPLWEPITRDAGPAYSRPLLGSELLTDQFHRYHDGFACPIIAATLELGIHDPRLRSWLYTPAKGAKEVREWAQEVVVVLDEPMEPDAFVGQTVERRLPYVLSNGREQLIRVYLFERVGDAEGAYSLFLHGPHCIMDARPTLDLFWFMFHSMSESNPAPLESFEWGSEWKNLPVGPVVATGGPRPDWEGQGIPAIQKIGSLLANPVPTLSIVPQRTEVGIVGRSCRVRKTFDEQQSAQILKHTKAAGCTVTHLFEAAQMIAIVARNPELRVPPSDAHVTYPLGFMSLAKFRVPPYDTRSQVVSSMAALPITSRYEEIPQPSQVDKEALTALMRKLKAQYDDYLKNPHFPHLTAALMRLAPPYEPVNPNPYATAITNIGVIDNMIPTTWRQDNDASKEPVFTITSMSVGHRLTSLIP